MEPNTIVGYEFGPFYLDARGLILLCGRDRQPLRPKAIDILLFLIENKDEVVTRSRLISHVWPGKMIEDGNLSHSIWSLRSVLVRPDYPDPIKTISRRGYRFSAEVSPRSGTSF
jgi:DNA-binding winged helix-turn-helix (wHTH) protein